MLINPYFISLTFNTGGIDDNIDLIKFFIKKNINIMPHVSCVNVKFLNFKKNLYFYYLNNIKNLLILKGDEKCCNNNYYSYNLVELININFKSYFILYTAIYCEFHNNSFNYKFDYKNLYIKNNFNIKYIITQYFYNIDSYYYCYDDLKKIIKTKIFIIPGLMPIYSINQLIKFSNLCKSDLPLWIIKRLNNFYLSNNEIRLISSDVLVNLSFKLLKFDVKYIHFYTMNNINFINNLLDKLLMSNNV